jgi:hypothetical protein
MKLAQGIKRDGSIQPFDRQRIENAVFAAARAVNADVGRAWAEMISYSVVGRLAQRCSKCRERPAARWIAWRCVVCRKSHFSTIRSFTRRQKMKRNPILSLIPIALGMILFGGLLTFLSAANSALAARGENAASPAAQDVVIEQALDFIASQQQPDGGIDGFGIGASNASSTARAVLAVAAAGESVYTLQVTGTTMLDYLAAHAIAYTHDLSGTGSANLFPANAGLLLAAISAANEDPATFGGMDFLSQLEATYHPATGAYSTTASLGWSSGAAGDINQAWAILGLSAAGRDVPQGALDYLVNAQGADGSWYYGDPDTTALAVTALIATGKVQPTDEVIQSALGFFATTQLGNGGWRPSWDTDPLNADSTGWIMQALAACGFTPATESWAAPDGNPYTALVSQQQANGSIGGTYVNAYSTIEALFGLTGQPLFFLGREIRAARALAWMNEQQLADGSWASFMGNAGSTADAVLAYAAAGFDPATVMAAGSPNSAMDYLATQAVTFTAKGPDAAGKLAVAVVAAGQDAASFGGVDIPYVLTNTHYSASLGGFGVITNTWHQAWAILGLAAAGEAVPVSATQTLIALQQPDGGWKYDLANSPWNTTTPDSTGLALQALIAGGVPVANAAVQDGLAFLQSQQDAQGGWGNANSTAYAIQGLLAAGEGLADWAKEDATPLEALMAYQKVDGPFVWAWSWPGDNGLATWQAIPTMMGIHYPYQPMTLSTFTATLRGADPDRLVVVTPRAAWGNSIDLLIPFGSDVDANGSVAVAYRKSGETGWITGTSVTRTAGFFTSTLPVTLPVSYDVRFTYTDLSGIQYTDQLTDTLELNIVVAPFRVYLPLVSR